MKILGIKKETKNKWERRVPLNPAAVKTLIEKGFRVIVEPSDIRIYSNDEYKNAGAEIKDDLSDCNLIIGVKEIPIQNIIPGIPHLFFSHTIKGQDYNMPLLQKFLDTKTTLLDYERIIDKKGRRLVFFGKFAGNAGMIDTLWALGQRLKQQYNLETPFLKMKHAYEYGTLKNALKHIKEIGSEISANGLPKEITPLNIFLMGYGHVSKGCQEVLAVLPTVEVDPDKLENTAYENNKLYISIFKEKYMVRRKDGAKFELFDYFQNGKEYESKMQQYLPHCSVYMNAIYWAPGYPVFLKNSELSQWKKLKIIGDITCDIKGSVEATVKATYPDNSTYIFNPETNEATDGFVGEGIANCAVDNLPCELPKEASDNFSNALMPFMESLLLNDYTQPIANSTLPDEIKPACIAHQGELEMEYEYLKEFLDNMRRNNV